MVVCCYWYVYSILELKVWRNLPNSRMIIRSDPWLIPETFLKWLSKNESLGTGVRSRLINWLMYLCSVLMCNQVPILVIELNLINVGWIVNEQLPNYKIMPIRYRANHLTAIWIVTWSPLTRYRCQSLAWYQILYSWFDIGSEPRVCTKRQFFVPFKYPINDSCLIIYFEVLKTPNSCFWNQCSLFLMTKALEEKRKEYRYPWLCFFCVDRW